MTDGPLPVLRIALRALGQGIITMILIPFVAAMALLAAGHLAIGPLAEACGAGSPEGCDTGAAGLASYAVLPGFLIGAVWSVLRDLRDLRRS